MLKRSGEYKAIIQYGYHHHTCFSNQVLYKIWEMVKDKPFSWQSIYTKAPDVQSVFIVTKIRGNIQQKSFHSFIRSRMYIAPLQGTTKCAPDSSMVKRSIYMSIFKII